MPRRKPRPGECKHWQQLDRLGPEDREEMSRPATCKCGYAGCCAIEVYDHMLILGMTPEHGYEEMK